MTLVFLILNIIQIIFIYDLNDLWWTAGVPAGVLAAFLACLKHHGVRSDHQAVGSIAKVPSV